MIHALETRLNVWVGPDIQVALSIVGNEDGMLSPEVDAIAHAIPKRRAEFAAGRRAARQALRAAGLPEAAIPQGRKRAPVWPHGTIGSISHDNGLAAACVASTGTVRRLGIDLADATAFPNRIRSQILKTPAEQSQSDIEALVTFSAKESVFKALFPDVGEYFWFDAVEVLPDLTRGTFSVRLCRDLGGHPAGMRLTGYTLRDGDRVFTLVALVA
ncbi:MAG: 4'-phosphopantetheinyl transferase superfamily protein [Pseudomonadota bacterium]